MKYSDIINTIKEIKDVHEPLDNDIPKVYLSGAHLPVIKDNQIMKMKYKSATEEFEC